MHFPFTRDQDGFILITVIWVLAAITLAAGFFATWVSRSVEEAREEDDAFQCAVDQAGTLSVLYYMLGTQYLNYAGLTVPRNIEELNDLILQQTTGSLFDRKESDKFTGRELALDGRIYEGVGSVLFSIQDEGGLTGINSPSYTGRIENLLGLLDVPVASRGPMIDKLLDYTDTDDLYRLNGAEADEYKNQGLSQPPNRPLLTTYEAKNVLGWKDVPGLWDGNLFPRLTTVARRGVPNFNTAPEKVLQTVPGIDSVTAKRIVDARREKPFFREVDLYAAIGKNLGLDPMELSFFPSSSLRISLRYKGGRRMREIYLKLTPKSNKAPWLVDYEISVPDLQKEAEFAVQTSSVAFFTTPASSNPE